MADHTINIDVYDISVPELNPINIAIINLPNPVIGYSANAKEVKDLIQIPKYTIYESGTSNVINGRNYYDYFPEEGGGGGGGGMTPEEVRTIVSNMTDSEVSDVSTNPIQNGAIKEYVDSTKVTVDSAIDEDSTNAIQNGVMTNFVNSSISTATATFRGTYNTKEALDVVSGDKNDYAFLVTTDAAGNTLYNRYKFVEAESGLPEGYTPLLYISNGNTHPIIDTGIVPNIHTGFDIKFNPGDPDIWGQCYFGAFSDSNFGSVDWKYSENDDHYQRFEIFRSGAVLTNTSHNSINEIVYSYPYITANNGTQQQVSPDDAIFTKDITIALFGLHYYSIGNYYDGVDNVQLYSFKLFDGSGNALRDFVPCKNDQNEVGLYDKVSETFFGNVKDSGVFIAGPNDTGHWEFEYSLNNSSFTSEQWAALNSGINSTKVEQIETNENNILSNENGGYLQNYNLSTLVGGTTADEGEIERRACNLAAGTYYISWVSTATSGGTVMTFLASNKFITQEGIDNSTSRQEKVITLSQACDEIQLYTNTANTVSEVMISKTANKPFVPYAPSNAELYSTIGDINTVLEEVL